MTDAGQPSLGSFDDTTWIGRYQGLDLESIQAMAKSEGRLLRVITPETVAITLDLAYSRLNVWLKADGTVDKISAG